MVAAASLETPRLYRDLPRVSKWLGRVASGRGEDHCDLPALLEGPPGAVGPEKTNPFGVTMEESQ